MCFSVSSPLHPTGTFGTGILSYFSFLRFLVALNLFIFVLMFSFVMLPIIVAPSASGNITYNQNAGERERGRLLVSTLSMNLRLTARFFRCVTAGGPCRVYPSSARRGLVIFHEHITDLLSGGVSPPSWTLMDSG